MPNVNVWDTSEVPTILQPLQIKSSGKVDKGWCRREEDEVAQK
jgi:hypothetical protein